MVQREAAALAPSGKAPGGRQVRKARVGVPDMGGEKLPEAALGVGRGEKSAGAADRSADRAGLLAPSAGRRSGNKGGGVYADGNGI